MKLLKTIIVVALLAFLIGIVSHMSYHDEVAEEKNYCDNILNGVWPDYNYRIDCYESTK
jgi:hypothetical protein